MLFSDSDHYNFLFLTGKGNVIQIGSALVQDHWLAENTAWVSWSFYTADKSGLCTSFINSAFSGILLRAWSHGGNIYTKEIVKNYK